MVSLRDVLRIAGQADAAELSTFRARIGELEAENARLKGKAEGQTVEGGEGINELRDQIRDLQEEDARGDLGKRLSVLDAKATVWHEISQAADKDEPTEISAMVRVIRELVGYARTLNRGTKRLRAELTRLKSSQEPFQQRVDPWLIACFGEEIARDQMERNHRFFEEATELVQANGMTASEAHQLVDYTYGRAVGEASQEVGGVMVTLAALCLASGLDMHAAAETELARIWTKVEKIRAKQAAKPKHSPLPEHVPASSQPEHDRTVRLAALEEAAKIADTFTCGLCGMDGKAAQSIRSLIDQTGGEGGI